MTLRRKFCYSCCRYKANDLDWQAHSEVRGDHLCWENPCLHSKADRVIWQEALRKAVETITIRKQLKEITNKSVDNFDEVIDILHQLEIMDY